MNKFIHNPNVAGHQSIVDRALAAKFTVSGSDVGKAVCKATTDELMPPKRKHLDYLLLCTNDANVSIPEMANLLIERTQNSSWVVVYKALLTVHNLMNYGNERFTQCLASTNCRFNLSNFADRGGHLGYGMSPFIRRYSTYLNEKASSYRAVGFDFCRVKRGKEDGFLRTMNAEKLLKTLPNLHNQLDAAVEFNPTSNDITNGIISSCFTLVFKDMIRLFACYNDGIINLLEKYFDMNKKMCREGLDIYKKFLSHTERVIFFFKVAEHVGIDKGDIPDLAKAPSSLLDALEQHLNSLEGTVKKAGSPTNTKPPADMSKVISTYTAAAQKGVAAGAGTEINVLSERERAQILEEEKRQLEILKKQRLQQQQMTEVNNNVVLPSVSIPRPSSMPSTAIPRPTISSSGPASPTRINNQTVNAPMLETTQNAFNSTTTTSNDTDNINAGNQLLMSFLMDQPSVNGSAFNPDSFQSQSWANSNTSFPSNGSVAFMQNSGASFTFANDPFVPESRGPAAVYSPTIVFGAAPWGSNPNAAGTYGAVPGYGNQQISSIQGGDSFGAILKPTVPGKSGTVTQSASSSTVIAAAPTNKTTTPTKPDKLIKHDDIDSSLAMLAGSINARPSYQKKGELLWKGDTGEKRMTGGVAGSDPTWGQVGGNNPVASAGSFDVFKPNQPAAMSPFPVMQMRTQPAYPMMVGTMPAQGLPVMRPYGMPVAPPMMTIQPNMTSWSLAAMPGFGAPQPAPSFLQRPPATTPVPPNDPFGAL